MDLSFPPELETFRAEVRDFFETEYPQDIRRKLAAGRSLSTEDIARSEQALGRKGWLAAGWPAEHGGPGWSLEQRYIFDEELARAGAQPPTPMGVIYVGPVLYTFASPEQQARWLPPLREGRERWAQGYSEPGAGSDLASLAFSAVAEDGGWRLNGEKIWTSAAQHADWIFLLARTGGGLRKQEGISFICCEMTRAGVTLHPIITLDGKHVLNRVTFDDVWVPGDYLIGEPGQGWNYSQYLLGHERTSYAHIAGKRRMLAGVRALANETPDGGNARLIDDAGFRRRLAETDLAVDALEMTVLRVLAAVKDGGAPGNEASIVKILATETHQKITELMLDAGGAFAAMATPDSVRADDLAPGPQAAAPPGVAAYLGGRAQSIYGGTNEIQKSIIARRVLGL